MPISLKVEDSNLNGFTKPAIDQAQVALDEYVKALMCEIDHLGQIRGHLVSGKTPEITATIVTDAKQILKRGSGTKPKGQSAKIIRIFEALFGVLVGIMYDKDQIQHNQNYLLVFILVVILMTVFICISVIKE